MKLDTVFPQEWKEISLKEHIPVSDILYRYGMEQLMLRLSESSYQEYLWLTNEEGIEKGRLQFYYVKSGKKNFSARVAAGDALSLSVAEAIAEELLKDTGEDLDWSYYIEETASSYQLNIEAHYQEMKLPFVCNFEPAPEQLKQGTKKELTLYYSKKKSCCYYSYSKESVLAEQLFELMRKLELVGDMECYSVANTILKSQSISGRHIMSEFMALAEKEPKVVNMKRLEQVEGYESYAYMRKKWQQYEKRHGRQPEEWSEVLGRILKFLKPTWTALCKNEIFFDDWMPELGRFLG